MIHKKLCNLAFILLLTKGLFASQSSVTHPNIIFILTDDQRWDAAGFAGNPTIQTPELDKLAESGTRFRNHFVTTSICCVSRASIFAGQYERRHGIGDFYETFTDERWDETYPAQLRKNGYYTGFIGKFGIGHHPEAVQPMAKKFDFWRGINGQGGNYFIAKDDPKRVHQTARYGEQALEFIREAPNDKPFCLSISFTAPHARDKMPREFTPDDRDESLYIETTIPMPELAKDVYFEKLPDAVQKSIARERWTWRFNTPEKYQKITKDYYRLISGIDRELGRIRAALEAKGVSENTIIIYSSDNGFALGDRGLAGKWFMYEESLRTPLVIYDPRQGNKYRAQIVDSLTLNIDLAPTLLALGGIAAPKSMQGSSLIPQLEQHVPTNWRESFFYEHHFAEDKIPRSEGVRSDRWAYIRWTGVEPPLEELFDIQTDPLETKNLASNPEYANALQKMRNEWRHYREDLK